MHLFPQLTPNTARALATQRATFSLQELEDISDPASVATIFTPTGGNRVSQDYLRKIQAELRSVARDYGYPSSLDTAARRRFDAPATGLLYEKMEIAPSEAAVPGVWSFVSIVLLPDLVRWRFPGGPQGTAVERFLGNNRGLRNAFGRLWWRAYILRDSTSENPYDVIFKLGEDELVQITERPNLAGSLPLARAVARTFLEVSARYPEIARSEILRDAMKRFRRLLPIISFDMIGPDELQKLTDLVFGDTVEALKSMSQEAGTGT